MVENSLNEFSSFVNQQIEYHEHINEYLSKAIALVQVAQSECFENHSQKIIYDYLWALCDIVETAHEANENFLNELLVKQNLFLSNNTQ